MQLQTAKQQKGESPRDFADRCRSLANKVMCKIDNPVAQRIHRENADRMKLASFVAGLKGVVGTQVHYTAPKDIRQAISLALSFEEAEKQEKFNETFYTRFGCCQGRPVDQDVRTASHGKQRTRKRQDACGVSATILHVTIAGHRTQRLGTHRPKLPSGALSAKG